MGLTCEVFKIVWKIGFDFFRHLKEWVKMQLQIIFELIVLYPATIQIMSNEDRVKALVKNECTLVCKIVFEIFREEN